MEHTSKAYDSSPRAHSMWKVKAAKLGLGVLATTVAIAALEMLLACLGVRPKDGFRDPYSGFSKHIPHFLVEQNLAAGPMIRVAPEKGRVLNTQPFAASKPPRTKRIVCLGGSTTYGRPFFDLTSFPGWLRSFLKSADSSTGWEVINAGAISYASYRVAGLMEELARYEPDLFIVYTGQNEFLERRTYAGLVKTPPILLDGAARLQSTRIAAVMRRGLRMIGLKPEPRSAQVPQLGDSTRAIPINAVGPEAYHRSDDFRAEVIRHFRASLERMVRVAAESNAKLVFVVPASNLADFAPFKSEHAEGLDARDLATWRQHEDAARTLFLLGDYAGAYREATAAELIDNRYAALWYLKGQILSAQERYAEARDAFQRAREEDICPLRAIGAIVSAVREVGREYNVPVIDFEPIVEQLSDHRIPGRKAFHDHVHPTIEANRMLALAIVEELVKQSYVQLDRAWGPETVERVTETVEAQVDRFLYAAQLRLLAAMHGWLRQPVPARYQAELSLELSGRSEEALLELAGLFASKGAPDLGEEYLRVAVELFPNSPETQSRLGMALASRGEWSTAEQHLQEAVRLRPNSASDQSNLGSILARLGRLKDAVERYDLALEVDRGFVPAHLNAGRALEQLGDRAAAVSHYQAVLQLAPDHIEARRRVRELTRP